MWCHEGVDSLLIGYDSLSVTISPSVVYPGDTADVVIKKKLPDGTLLDFDSTQTFEVAKLEGCIWGNLLVGDSLSSYFYDVRQPIKFVVDNADTVINMLVTDTGKVIVGVGLIAPEKRNKKINTQAFDVTDCFTGPAQNELSPAVTEIQNPLEIISPTEEDIDSITITPEMPNVLCQARMKNYIWGNVAFEWDYKVSYILHRHSYYCADTLCRRTGMIKIKDVSSAYYSNITNWWVLFDESKIDTAKFVSKKPYDPCNLRYGGNCSEVRNYWTEGNSIFIGGDVFVKVTAKDENGNVIGINQKNAGVILGTNPQPNTIRNYASPNDFKAIIMHESNSKLIQFNTHDHTFNYPKNDKHPAYVLPGSTYNKKGYPVYGVPNGYGLAQIDSNPTELDLWNWKHNIDTGRERLNGAKNKETDFEQEEGSLNNDKYFWMNVFEFYNDGGTKRIKRYWKW